MKKRILDSIENERESKFLKEVKEKKVDNKPTFVIPNEYLSLENRTVEAGEKGYLEKLRRDRLKAEKRSKR